MSISADCDYKLVPGSIGFAEEPFDKNLFSMVVNMHEQIEEMPQKIDNYFSIYYIVFFELQKVVFYCEDMVYESGGKYYSTIADEK